MNAQLPPYHFDRQYLQGERGAAFLDSYFARWFQIERATQDEQRRGIDRYFTSRDQKHRLSVEYKTDETASRTGNAFVEIVSVDTSGKAGWAYTSEAEYLLYYLPKAGLIYMLKMAAIRMRLAVWKEQYPTRHIPNHGYQTHGLLVPLSELERYAEALFKAPPS